MARNAFLAAWAILGALLVLGILLPPLTYMRPREPPILAMVAFVALPILLLATLLVEARGPPGVASRRRIAFALGTMHFVLWDAYMLLAWTAFDYARDIYGDIILRAGFWVLNVVFAYVGIGPHDLARLDARWWVLPFRAMLAGVGLALSSVLMMGFFEGELGSAIMILPLAAFFAVPLGIAFGLGFAAIDLAVAGFARLIALGARDRA